MKKLFLVSLCGLVGCATSVVDVADNKPNADECVALYASTNLPEVKNGNTNFVLYPLEHTAYNIWYSSYFGGPACVVQRLRMNDFDKHVAQRSDNFHEDPILAAKYPEVPRACKKSYSNSGYDRGHQAPSGDYVRDQTLQDETFSMANMVPQVGELNQREWSELEGWVRSTATNEGEIVVLTGPIMRQDEVSGLVAPTNWVNGIGSVTNTEPTELQIAIPDACYKVVVDLTPPCKVIAFRLVNDPEVCKTQKWEQCVCPLDRIEAETKLELLQGLLKKYPELEVPFDCWAME